MRSIAVVASTMMLISWLLSSPVVSADEKQGAAFFERHIRPLLVRHCYDCHSEAAQVREGGLLLDRESGWLQGGDSGKAIVPGSVEASLLWKAVTHSSDDLQMPPDEQLDENSIALFKRWIAMGAPGPEKDLGSTEFSELGNQTLIFQMAATHWAFQPLQITEPPQSDDPIWNQSAVDRFVYSRLKQHNLKPSRSSRDRDLLRRLHYDLTGLPPTMAQVRHFEANAQGRRPIAVQAVVDDLLASNAFGQHVGRLWLDVARYADTDSSYRADTRTPHYFPFAFPYRDYVIDSFNADKPIDQFIKEQLAADLMGFEAPASEIAALGFLTVGPHANTAKNESPDDWIDVTTRGLMGLTVACARCHDHKYEPIPTADYYSLHGVFTSVQRIAPLDEKRQPLLTGYVAQDKDLADYTKRRAAIAKKIKDAGNKTSKNNQRSIAEKIRETELAELLLFHPGAPVHAMTVAEIDKPITPFIFERGEPSNRGDRVPRRFLKVLNPDQRPFSKDNSGRLDLANAIVDPQNPLTARVFVNRIWGLVMGAHLVATPSDFGLQGVEPTHPQLLDWLTSEFIANGWSTKWLVRTIVQSRAYQQRSDDRPEAYSIDPENKLLWRANRKHLSIEEIRDTILAASGQLNPAPGGRPEPLWEDGKYTKRRAIYGYVNRFNLDPTLRAFDFPARMQTVGDRGESVVAPQALFTMNSSFVIDQAIAITELSEFKAADSDEDRVAVVFEAILQRAPAEPETAKMLRFVEQQERLFETVRKGSRVTNPWPLMTQALLMSNELQYID